MTGRDHALDGIRGWAALAVAFSHVAAMRWIPFLDGGPAPSTADLLLWNLGAPAVDIFFVLSGYVVARSLMRRPQDYGGFLLHRFVRLLPIAWLGVLAGLALRTALVRLPGGMSAGTAALLEPIGNMDAIAFATMTFPLPRVELVNPVLWSMFAETQITLLMPLLALAAIRRWWAPAALAAIAIPSLMAATSNYYPLCFAGFAVGASYAAFEPRMPKPPRPAMLLAVGLALLMARLWTGIDSDLMRPMCAIGALGVIIAVRQGSLRGALTGAPSRWLGRISYPLYALHYPVMVGACVLGAGAVGLVAASIMSIPVSLVLASIASRLVDEPATRLSKALRG